MGLAAPLFASGARSRERLRSPQPRARCLWSSPPFAGGSLLATGSRKHLRQNKDKSSSSSQSQEALKEMLTNNPMRERCFKTISTGVTWSHFPPFIQSSHHKKQSAHFTNKLIMLWHASLEEKCLLSSFCEEGDDLLFVLCPGYLRVQLEHYQAFSSSWAAGKCVD